MFGYHYVACGGVLEGLRGLRWGDWAEGWLREGDLEGGNGAMWGRVAWVVRESAEMVN